MTKKNNKKPTLNDYLDVLKSESVVDNIQWRNPQLLADIRNKRAHADEE